MGCLPLSVRSYLNSVAKVQRVVYSERPVCPRMAQAAGCWFVAFFRDVHVATPQTIVKTSSRTQIIVHDVGDHALTLSFCTLLPELASTLQEIWTEKRCFPRYIVWSLRLPSRRGGRGEHNCGGGDWSPR